jgi:hypothetical protein
LEKWRLQNQQLPKHQRKPEPIRPKIIRSREFKSFKKSFNSSRFPDDGTIDQFATNAAMYEAAQAQLVGCEHCGRTFNPDRLEVHQKSCTSINPAKSLPGALRGRRASPARGY